MRKYPEVINVSIESLHFYNFFISSATYRWTIKGSKCFLNWVGPKDRRWAKAKADSSILYVHRPRFVQISQANRIWFPCFVSLDSDCLQWGQKRPGQWCTGAIDDKCCSTKTRRPSAQTTGTLRTQHDRKWYFRQVRRTRLDRFYWCFVFFYCCSEIYTGSKHFKCKLKVARCLK